MNPTLTRNKYIVLILCIAAALMVGYYVMKAQDQAIAECIRIYGICDGVNEL